MPPSDLGTVQGKGSEQAREPAASTTSSTTKTSTTTLGTLAKCCAQILTQSFASKRDSNNGQTNEEGHATQKMLRREVEREMEEEGTQQEPIQTCWQTFTRATHGEHATISLFGVCRVRQKCDRRRSWRRHRTAASPSWNWSSKELTALFRNGLKREW